MIPRSEIEAVKERADIAEVISSYGITLKGTSSLKGLCPFHNENTPSFNVRPAFGTYRCFGCGASGDVFNFIQEHDGFSFTDAVKMVAERYNMVVTDTADQEDEEDRQNKRRLYDLMKEAARFYANKYRTLPQDHPARLELRKRDLEEVEGAPTWLRDWGIGYAPEGWSTTIDYLVSKGYSHNEIVTAGMAGRSEKGRLYDLFRGRLTWEIRDIQGRVIGFNARKLFDNDNGPKYLNSPQTPIYDKSRVLFGLDLARKAAYSEKKLIVVEGCTDVMALAATGIDYAVNTCGTAFGDQHATVALRLLGDNGKLIFGFDGDAAGQKAARRTFEISAPIHNSSYVIKPGEGDPCDVRLEHGDLALQDMFAEANLTPLTEFVLRQELTKHNTDTAEGRSAFLRAAAPLLSHITDYSMREDYIRKVTFWSGSTIEVVRSIMKRGSVPQGVEDQELLAPPDEQGAEGKSVSRSKQESIIALMLQYPSEFHGIMGGSPESKNLFDEDLLPLYTEVWYLIKQKRGNLGKITPDDFSAPKLVLDLMYKEFPEIERAKNDLERRKTVARLGHSFYDALNSLAVSDTAQSLRARIGQAYGQDKVSNDTSALAEIFARSRKLKSQKRNRRRR